MRWRDYLTATNLLGAAAAAVVLGSLWYTNRLVGKLAEKERRLVDFWAEVYQYISRHDNPESVFLVEHFVLRRDSAIIQVPAVVADENGRPVMHNLRLPHELPENEQRRIVERELQKMKAGGYQPIRVEYTPGNFQFVWYRETDELIQLRYFPLLTAAVLTVFVAVMFVNFYVSQKSRQNKVWAGLARETAHQLGTPITGLVGWLQLLRESVRNDEDAMIVEELGKDVERLQRIAERFSKIGSAPELVACSLKPILAHAVEYVAARIGKSGRVKVELRNELADDCKVEISPTLFEWMVENLVKNALDALPDKGGEIRITASDAGAYVILDVSDTGKGIARKDFRRIFQPGYTTKKRGWGLGLSLSKRIVENFHSGRIFVLDSQPGVGTTFRVVLPKRQNRNRGPFGWFKLRPRFGRRLRNFAS
ncbi:MAG: HAMP domain-containing sensor histidine kinase [Bacteroidia bacterium]|nr:HAMP domain-containing histidine kinase [Bacteroidia bacterium]MDW8333796.1 HAMP domain-containing sensor histidine kinase [Bacteroidia bacterium]